MLARLEAKGLVVRAPDGKDGRSIQVRLSASARNALDAYLARLANL